MSTIFHKMFYFAQQFKGIFIGMSLFDKMMLYWELPHTNTSLGQAWVG